MNGGTGGHLGTLVVTREGSGLAGLGCKENIRDYLASFPGYAESFSSK